MIKSIDWKSILQIHALFKIADELETVHDIKWMHRFASVKENIEIELGVVNSTQFKQRSHRLQYSR